MILIMDLTTSMDKIMTSVIPILVLSQAYPMKSPMPTEHLYSVKKIKPLTMLI